MSDDDNDEHPLDRLARVQERAILAAQAVDQLVFVLTGKEIQAILIAEAEMAEAAAADDETRTEERPNAVGFPPGSLAPSLRKQAKSWRFLAAHIEEDRIFRLGLHDLSFLGFKSMYGDGR